MLAIGHGRRECCVNEGRRFEQEMVSNELCLAEPRSRSFVSQALLPCRSLGIVVVIMGDGRRWQQDLGTFHSSRKGELGCGDRVVDS